MGPTVRLFALTLSFFFCLSWVWLSLFPYSSSSSFFLLFFSFHVGFWASFFFFPFHCVSISFFLLEFVEVVAAVDVEVVIAVAVAAIATMGCSDGCDYGFFFFFFGFLEKKNIG